eukprot:GHVL01040192.1.p1 GENE.GHVL01040192.1~~GHVL01040192.1.p1  ORF type:complete len:209 (-),score=46.58 GHVL01040192.1:270-896(-)
MDFNLENDVAIVTGAASCVGRAVSKILLENGAKVMMVDSASESLDEILKDIKKDGKTVESLACNIMIDDERSEVVKRTVKRLEENITKNQKNILINQTPLKRLGEAEDIAAAVLFFVSNASSWITGQILTVNGGGTQTLQESPDVINYLSLLSQGEATSISVTPREKKNKEVSFRSDKSLISTEPMHKSPRKLKHSKKSKKTRSCFTK